MGLKRFLLRPKTAMLWHQETPGTRVRVTRTWIGRMLKPVAFATLTESMKAGIHWHEEEK